MAVVVRDLPERKYGRRGRWPDKFLDGQVWRLKQGEDFTTSVNSARTYVTQCAAKAGVKIATRLDGEYLYVQAWSR